MVENDDGDWVQGPVAQEMANMEYEIRLSSLEEAMEKLRAEWAAHANKVY